MNKEDVVEKAIEKLEYYRNLSRNNKMKSVKVNKNDGLVRRFLNRISKGEI